MRIAIDARKWRDYGIGTYVRNLVRHLARLDHETTYFLFCSDSDQATLRDLGERRLNLANTNFDTGKPSAHGDYALADETYADLLDRLAERHFADVPPALRQNILAYYAAAPDKISGKKELKRIEKVRRQLVALKSTER